MPRDSRRRLSCANGGRLTATQEKAPECMTRGLGVHRSADYASIRLYLVRLGVSLPTRLR